MTAKMPHATCLRCTRIFLGPFRDGDVLPEHLDALLGLPCVASGTLAILGAPMPFYEIHRDELPVWPIERR